MDKGFGFWDVMFFGPGLILSILVAIDWLGRYFSGWLFKTD